MEQWDFLRGFSFFSSLEPAGLQEVFQLLSPLTFKKNGIIILDGEPSVGLYLIKSGEVKIYKVSREGREQVLGIIGPGESFNEVPIFDDGPNPATAEALTDVELYLMTKANFLRLVETYPQVALEILRLFARRLRRMVLLAGELSLKDVTSRLAGLLLRSADVPPSRRPRLTQQEMAAMIGTAREVVSRSLARLAREGIIQVERNEIIILNKEKLEGLA